MTTMQMSLGFSGSRPFFFFFFQLLLVHYLDILNGRLVTKCQVGLEWSESIWDISLLKCECEDGYEKGGGRERKKKEIFPKYVLFWSSPSWWDNYLNPDSNIYFAVPHFGGFQVSPLHSPYVHWVVYRFRCSALFGGAQNGGLFIRAAAIPVVNVCCYIFRLSAVTTAPISAILVVLFSLSF